MATDAVLNNMRMVPKWGTPVVYVSWLPQRGVEQLRMQLQRSYGGDKWENVTPAPVRGLVSEEDTGLFQGYDLQQPMYRVRAVDNNNKEAFSNAFRMYSHVPRQALLLAKCLINREYQYMRADKTPEVLVLSKIVKGEECVCKDVNSGMTVGAGACPYCYGTGTYGGYWKPYATLCKFIAAESIDIKAVQDGSDYAADNTQEARMFGIEDINVDDIIVIPATDERYVVVKGSTDKILGYLPAATQLQLKKLDPRDARQKIPINNT